MQNVFEVQGFCPICAQDSSFRAERETPISEEWFPHWFRADLKCQSCKSPPRERALAHVIESYFPEWRNARMHECSPGGWALSSKLRRDCQAYTATQYDPSFAFGEMHSSGRWRNENLESLTFEDEAFDVFVAQDVFEHLFDPAAAIREVARTLRPGGYCFMTVPVVNRFHKPTERRAGIEDGEIVHHLPESYHGNPVGDGKALVTVDWSLDIGAYLSHHAGMPLAVILMDDMRIGVRDNANVLIVGRKSPLSEL